MDPGESSEQQGPIPSPPSAQYKKCPAEKSLEKKKTNEKYVELSNKEVADTLLRLSTPLRSKNSRIIVKFSQVLRSLQKEPRLDLK